MVTPADDLPGDDLPGGGLAVDDVAARLVDSARRLLEDGGLAEVTVRSVAIGAGMSTMNVYSRFGGKDGLLDVLYREGFEALRAELEAVDAPDLPARLRAAAAAYRRFALEHPARYELMFGGERRGFRPGAESVQVARGLLTSTSGAIATAAAQGEIELPDGVGAAEMTAGLWAMCHGALEFETGSVADAVLDWSAVYAAGVDALVERYCRTPSPR